MQKQLSDKFGIKLLESEDKTIRSGLVYLREDKVDFYVGDMTDAIVTDRVILSDFKGAAISNYGILYPKGSILKKKLDKYIKYYKRSSSYYQLLGKHFGKEIVNYFRTLAKEQ